MSTGLGGDRIEGRRAVRELLVTRRRRVHEVWIAAGEPSEALDEIAGLAREAGAALRRVDADELRTMARTEAPQGVVANAEALQPDDLDDLLGGERPFLVALDSVTDPRNVGAVLRSAEGAGATGVILPRHRAAAITPATAKAAAGAVEHLRFAQVGGIPSALERARKQQVWVVGLDEGGDTSLFDLELATEPIVIVLGAEGEGLGRLARERCDLVASIPMAGRIESLNVASAATLACYEVARRRAL